MAAERYVYVPKNLLKFIAVFLAVVVQIFISSPIAKAQSGDVSQQGNGMQVSPAVRTFTLDPGESANYELRLTNITDKIVQATSVISDFEQKDGEEGIPILLLDDRVSPYSLKGFVTDLGKVKLEPKKQKIFNVAINVPKDASPGAHYGAIRFISDGGEGSGETVVNLAAGIGVLVFINVTGDARDSLSLLQVSAAKNGKMGSIFDKGPVGVVTRVRNNGNTYLKPFGRIIVKDWKDKVISEKDFNSEKAKLVLPGTVRRLEDTIDLKKHNFGRYKVEINMSYGEGGGDIVIGQTTFWIMPWKQVLVGTVVLVLLIFAIINGLMTYKRSILKEARKSRR